ncbi:MAG: GNAT family N-acetyltransferase [Caldilineales bacterium]|nr:GNAT family N-acetyltransferase [Caldilineales bacterium]
MSDIHYAAFDIGHYDQALALWQACEGIGLSVADERERIATYLLRNPGLSLVALAGDAVVGAALCGHDGRRGFIHHLAVSQAYRGRGIGRRLAESCLAGLREHGIDKCHLFVVSGNEAAIDFWRASGWFERIDLTLMSKNL